MVKLSSLTDQTFETTVAKSEVPILVDFGADWCPPCRQLDPVLDELALELDGQVVIGKLDVDENPHTTLQYGVMGLPTLLLFKGGKLVDRIVGFQPRAQLLKRLQPQLSP